MPCKAPFSMWSHLLADIGGDDIILEFVEEQPEIEEDDILELMREQIAEANTSLIGLRQRVAHAIARMEAMDAAAKGGS